VSLDFTQQADGRWVNLEGALLKPAQTSANRSMRAADIAVSGEAFDTVRDLARIFALAKRTQGGLRAAATEGYANERASG
jgi:hypothetical protein